MKKFSNYFSAFVVFSILSLSFQSLAQQYVVFNKVVTSVSWPSSKADNVQNLTGTNFKFVSSGSTFANSISGNDYTGTLEYYNSSNVKQVVSGTMKGVCGNNPTDALTFFNTANSMLYLLVMPGRESQSKFTNGTNGVQFNSSGAGTDLNALYSKQTQASTSTTSNSIVINMADPAAVTESNTAYIVFTLTLSGNRSASSSTISFTPTLTDITTTTGSDYVNAIQFSTDNITYNTATSYTIPYNVNTLYMRVALKDDALPENTETFTLNTNSFSGATGELANGSTGAVATGSILDDGDPYLWVGGTSTNWNTAANWNANAVPPSTAKAKIPSGVTNYPTISSDNSITDLEIVSGASLNTGSNKLTVLGNLTNNGDITGSGLNGKLSLGGSSAQTITGTGSIDNLELNNSSGATISSGTLTLNKGLFPTSGVLTTNGNLTMNSTSTQTASVFQRGGSCTTYISGDVTLKRYIDPANNGTFRFIGNPFNSASKTFSSFTNLPLTSAYKYNSSYATPDPTNANGDPAWAQVGGADIFEQNKGIISFISGATPFTIQATGPVNQCDVTMSVSSYSNNDANKGFVLIANPYMSYLDLSQNTSRSSVYSGFYVWDTGTNTTDASSQKSRQANFNYKGKYNTVVPGQSGVAQIVPPLGSFFIKVSQGAGLVSGSITFKETEKWNSNSISDYVPFSVNKPKTQNTTEAISKPFIYNLRLMNNGSEVDLYRLVFREGATNEFDNWDLTKMLNSDLNLFSKMPNNNYAFAVDTRSTTFDAFEVPLYLTTKLDISTIPFEFQWNADNQTLDANFVLEDNLTHNKYFLNNNSKISFVPGKFDNSKPRFNLLVSPKISENLTEKKAIAYPNPFTNYLYVGPMENMSGPANVEILNMLGIPVHSTSVEMETNVAKYVPMPTLSTGSYILKLSDSKGSILTQKIIKQ